jgi:hypothetical protein
MEKERQKKTALTYSQDSFLLSSSKYLVTKTDTKTSGRFHQGSIVIY